LRDTLKVLIRIPRQEIAYFNFLLESYEGLASVRTLEAKEGIMELHVPPELLEELRRFLEGLKEEMDLRCLEFPQPLDGLP